VAAHKFELSKGDNTSTSVSSRDGSNEFARKAMDEDGVVIIFVITDRPNQT
jgi:hypothetical protein